MATRAKHRGWRERAPEFIAGLTGRKGVCGMFKYLTGFLVAGEELRWVGETNDYDHAVSFVLTNNQDKGSDIVPIIAIKTSDGYTSAIITIDDDEVVYL